jgi:serine/threonine-protein kinase
MPELETAVRARLEAQVSVLAATVAQQGVGGTIRPAQAGALDATWAAIGKTLPVLDVAAPASARSADAAELEIGEVLGEGGMGIVRLAVQNPLGRDVAVKTVKPSVLEAQALLVREAITTGRLEHPNIVPIHTLGRDTTGAPLLVMKRITGVSWLGMIHDRSHPAWAGVTTGDPLEFHLETLMQVSNAVHFAHSKRVLHRDLKPENVMIGSYGEVYVLDWGIALALDGPRPSGDGIVGTPAYMAPEMVRSAVDELDERTDVYLLGAILHEIITGSPPHTGTLIEVLESALASPPRAYGDDVPRPLAAIARRAMHRERAERHASADEFRRAIGEFLRQRSSLRVSDEAAKRLRELEALIREGQNGEGVDAVVAYKLFGECRFGFQHAIATFADNAEAKAGLARAIEGMVGYELDRKNAKAAAVLLAELPSPPPELAERLRAAERDVERERAELEKLRRIERDADVGVGSKARAVLALGVAMGFNVGAVVLTQVAWGSQITTGRALAISVAFLVSVGVAIFIARGVVTQNAANRRMAWALLIAALAMLAHRAVAVQLGSPVSAVFAGDLVILATSGATVAATLDRRLTWVAVFLALSPFLVALRPEWMAYTFPAAATVGVLILAAVWRGEASSG